MRREPWQRFEAKVDPEGGLAPQERARRAKIAYRAFMRRIAKRSAKVRAAKRAREAAALRRRQARPPSEKELEAFRCEREEWTDFLIIWAAAQRGE